jgi:hypothetical protein
MEDLMRHGDLLLPVVSAFALLCAASSGLAATFDDEWQALEQSYESSAPPTKASDCDKYTTASAKGGCMDYVNKNPTLTYRAHSPQLGSSDQAAIRYCARIGKTFQNKGPSATDPMLMTYQCK